MKSSIMWMGRLESKSGMWLKYMMLKNVMVVVVVVVLGVPSFVLSFLPLFVIFAVVAFTVFLVVLIDGIIDKIVDGCGHEAHCENLCNVVFSLVSLCSREYTVKSWKILRPVQIGPNFCVPITGVCIPCAFFLEADGNAVVKVVVRPSRILFRLSL